MKKPTSHLLQQISPFGPTHPLHLLKGEEKGMDTHMLLHIIQQRFGLTARFITPSQLRLIISPNKNRELKWYGIKFVECSQQVMNWKFARY